MNGDGKLKIVDRLSHSSTIQGASTHKLQRFQDTASAVGQPTWSSDGRQQLPVTLIRDEACARNSRHETLSTLHRSSARS
jgi:hypothetical protein